MHKLLILGKNGQVGHELARALAPLGDVIALDRSEADLTRPESVAAALSMHRPVIVVNAAAYTAVDRAESEEALSSQINGFAPGAIAQACTGIGARLVHYSTDYVFDGQSRVPYGEEDPTNPLGIYGRTKREGEKAVLGADLRHLVLRLAWVYGTRGRNFMSTMLRLGREGHPLRVVDDQYGAPSWSRCIADATAHAVSDLLAHPEAGGGLYHLGSEGQTTWCGFAREIVTLAIGDAAPTVTAITTAEYPTPAARPAYSRLNSRRFRDRFGVGLPEWRTQLRMAVEDLP